MTARELATQFGVLPWLWHQVLLHVWRLTLDRCAPTSPTVPRAALAIAHHRRQLRAWHRRVRRGC